jgi:recombination protein RecT
MMAVNNSIAKSRKNAVDKPKELRNLIAQMTPAIAKALPSMIGKDRFVRVAMSAISNTPELANCTQDSFLGALMNSAQLGLEPNTPIGQAYLIPYAGKCQFQIGYKGMIELARRAGITIQVHEIKENDKFEYEYGLEPKLRHIPSLGDRGQTIGYYCVWKNTDGQFGVEVSSREEVLKFAKEKSQAFNKGPWKTDFDAMAKKTLIKAALKYAPLAIEAQLAMAADETVKNVSANDALSDTFDISLVKAEEEEKPEEKPEPKPVVNQQTGEVIDVEIVDQRPEPVPPAEEESLI